MRDFGYEEGRDFIVEWRFAEGNFSRHPEFAIDLARLKVDIIVLGTTSALPAVKQATSTIPIVMAYSIDPVGSGFVASLARPGGNTTGLVSALDDIISKHLELLKDVKPSLSRFGLLSNPNSPNHRPFVKSARAAANMAGMTIVELDARNREEIETAFATAAAERVEAVGVLADAIFNLHRERVAELAIANRLPSIFSQREYVQAGGMMSYGETLSEVYRRVTYFVDRIFKGTKPADLPVEQPSSFQLSVNLKTAKAIGHHLPEAFLLRADEVVE